MDGDSLSNVARAGAASRSAADHGSIPALDVPGAAGEPDIHTTAGKIADLERRRHEAVHAGPAAAVAKQHARGKLTARETLPPKKHGNIPL